MTDIRLEALSSVHQVDQLKEYMEKLKIDMMSLKSENQLLKSYIQDYYHSQKINLSNKDFDKNCETFLECILNDTNSKFTQSFEKFHKNVNNNNHFYSYSKLNF